MSREGYWGELYPSSLTSAGKIQFQSIPPPLEKNLPTPAQLKMLKASDCCKLYTNNHFSFWRWVTSHPKSQWYISGYFRLNIIILIHSIREYWKKCFKPLQLLSKSSQERKHRNLGMLKQINILGYILVPSKDSSISKLITSPFLYSLHTLVNIQRYIAEYPLFCDFLRILDFRTPMGAKK